MRRDFLKTAALAIVAACLIPFRTQASPAKEKPIGSPLGLKLMWRLESGKWVRRRLKEFRPGDEIVVFNRGHADGEWSNELLPGDGSTWAAKGDVNSSYAIKKRDETERMARSSR